ncbi:MAG: site-specific integrase [Pseudomonadota bacterium]
MATIRQRITTNGEKRYHTQVRIQGHPTLTATFTHLKDARKWAAEKETAIHQGRHFDPVESKQHTLAELADKYLAEDLASKSTIQQKVLRSRVTWWRNRLGAYALANITPALITECRDELLAEGLKNDTVHHYLATLSTMFTTAINDWQWLKDNPCKRIRKPKRSRGHERYLSEHEKDTLLNACQASPNPHLYTAVVIALHTGARKSEILNLSWADIDFKRQRLTFRDTKNGETRSVPLKGQALEILRARTRIRRIDTDFVFPNHEGEPADIRKAWENARAKAELENFRFHDLRHTAASYLAMNGASLLEIAEILGHKTLSMVKRYTHLTESHTAGVVENMNQNMFG